MTEENFTLQEMMETREIIEDNFQRANYKYQMLQRENYIVSFSSIKSCNCYDVWINKTTGSYTIESEHGNIKYEGYLHVELRDATSEQLNNYALNITDLYYEWSDKINS